MYYPAKYTLRTTAELRQIVYLTDTGIQLSIPYGSMLPFKDPIVCTELKDYVVTYNINKLEEISFTKDTDSWIETDTLHSVI